ncbi:hypothetical protein PCIT_a2761 [Pseudoalteromonas citrea]|uniref:Uncharacterized protein n=1 Tax=Pseudoalteromonas citrea TaxID=43655 RepID=A0AAD4AHQ2_9GAMM|nr:hypothetical protein PCIT_a2761 [Pseudoalteromonas citrea]
MLFTFWILHNESNSFSVKSIIGFMRYGEVIVVLKEKC